MTVRNRRVSAALLSSALIAGLLAIPAATAQAAPVPQAGASPVAGTAPVVPAPLVNLARQRALGARDAAVEARVMASDPAAPRQGSDGVLTQRDLRSGAVRPLDGTKLAPEAASSPCGRPVGRVRTAGPGDIWLAGTAKCSGGVWRLTVTGGSGHIGGMPLASSQFSGWLAWDARGATSKVSVGLPLQPKVAPAWTQSARASLRRSYGPWTGRVDVGQGTTASASLTMRGPLGPGNSYALAAVGAAPVAGKRVALSGWFRSPTLPGAKATWQIGGRGTDGSFPGARVLAPVVWMTQAQPGVTGRETVVIDAPTPVRFPATFDVRGSRDWTIRTAGAASPGAWVPSSLPGATVTARQLSGSIGSSSGKVSWALTAPMVLVENRLTVQGSFDVRGPATWRLRPLVGTGRILDVAADLPLTGSGSATIDHGRVSGSLDLRADGEMLIDLPEGWTSSTTYSLLPRAGSRIGFTHRVDYASTDGASRFSLLGTVDPAGGPYHLIASGSFDIEGSGVPVGGELSSVGWKQDGGAALTEPLWTTFADIGSTSGVPLPGGGALLSGRFGFEGHGAPDLLPEGAAPMANGASTPLPSPTYTTTGIKGVVEVQPTSSNPFSITSNYTYTNSTNWTLTVAPDANVKSWTPMPGLTFSESVFHGNVKDVNGVQTWSVTTSNVAWSKMTEGATMGAVSWTMTNTCSLGPSVCPTLGYTSVYMSETGGVVDFADSTPDTAVTGSFIANGQWSRFSGTPSGTVTYNTMQLDSLSLTIYNGQQQNPPDPNLILPDINGSDVDFQICGNFIIQIPVVIPTKVRGCAQWSDAGVILAQSTTTGDFTTNPTNNVNIKKGSLTGYAWTNLPHAQNISIDEQPMRIQHGRQYILTAVVIPGRLMHDSGAGTSLDSTFFMIGSFTTSDVEIKGSVPIGISNGTITVEAMSVSIHLADGGLEEVEFGMNGGAVVEGKEYQLDAALSAETEESLISVSLTVKGTRSDDPLGGFEMASLIPSGDFEPENTQLVSSSLDGKQGPNALTDGGFENGTDKQSLIPNPGFEDGVGANLVDDPSFESQSGRNLLDNADAEDTELLTNGDFDTYLDASGKGTMLGWTADSGITTWVNADSANGDITAQYSTWVQNTKSTVTGGIGLRQVTQQYTHSGYVYRLSFWARSDGGDGTIQGSILRAGGTSNCASNGTSQTFSMPSSAGWKQFTMDYTADSCSAPLSVVLDPYKGSWTFALDSASLKLVSAPTGSNTTLQTVGTNVPTLVERFDSQIPNPVLKSAGTTASSSYGGSVKSNSCEYYYLDGLEKVNGDFEGSVDVIFPASSTDSVLISWGIQNAVGKTGPDSTSTGWAFRVSAGSSDQGMHKVNGSGNNTRLNSGFSATALAKETWYTVHIVSIGNQLTGWVTRLSDGHMMFRQVYTVSGTYSPAGYFGQSMEAGGYCDTTHGHYLDNVAMRQGAGSTQGTYWPQGTHPNDQESNTSILSITAPGNHPFTSQYTVYPGDVSGTYTYSAWLRSRNGTASANLMLETVDTPTDSSNPREYASVAINLTTSWQQFSVTVPINNGGHLGLRAGLVGVAGEDSSGGYTNVLIDDQALTQIGWNTYPTTANTVTLTTSPVAHTGTASMAITDHNNGSEIKYSMAAPIVGAKYHLSMWVASASTYSGQVVLTCCSVNPPATAAFTARPTSGGALQWQEVKLDFIPTSSTEGMFLDIETLTGNNGKVLYVDDVSVSVTYADTYADGKAGNLARPAGWATSSGNPHVVTDPNTAHSGKAFMRVDVTTSPQPGTAVKYQPSSPILAGQLYTFTAWIKTPDGNGTTATASFIAMASNTASSPCTSIPNSTHTQALTTSWTPITVTCAPSGSAIYLGVFVNSNSSQQRIDIDDVQMQTTGMNLADPWVITASSGGASATASALTDPSIAHSGSDYLSLTCVGAGAVMRLDTPVNLANGTTQFVDGYFRSGGSSQVSVRMKLIGYSQDSSGALTQQAIKSWDVGAPVGSWAYDFTSVTWPSNVTVVRTQFETLNAGDVALIDDVQSRQVAQWTKQSSASMDSVIIQRIDSTQAAAGAGYLSMHTYGNVASSDTGRPGAAVVTTQTVNAGGTYQLQAYARITPGRGSAASLRLGATFGTGSGAETRYQSFALTPQWQLFTTTITAQSNHGSVPVAAFVASDNRYGNAADPVDSWIDIDELQMTPQIISADPSWQSYTDGGGTLTWANADDRSRAHNGSMGLAELTKTSSSGRAGLLNYAGGAVPAKDSTFTASAWVRSPVAGVAISGTLELVGDGGTDERVSTAFTAPSTGEWTLVTAQITFSQSNHTGMHVALLQTTQGALDVDDIALGDLAWTTSATTGSTSIQTLIHDATGAQGGANYLRLTNSGSGTAQTTETIDHSYANGTALYPTVWLRSTSGDDVTVHIVMGSETGAQVVVPDRAGNTEFTVGQDWTELSLKFITGAAYSDLQMSVVLLTPDASVDIDSFSISDSDSDPDGIVTPLQNPEHGWEYLSDSLLGIDGVHLWAFTGQIQFNTEGLAGIGMSTTSYLDPAKMPSLLTGTAWIKSSQLTNMSDEDPCIAIKFDAGNSGSGLQIKGGALKTTLFYLYAAPAGCQMGEVNIPRGISVGFTSQLGDGTIRMQLQFGKDSKGRTIYSGEAGLANVKIGYTQYESLDLVVSHTASEDYLYFNADVIFPFGRFFGRIDMESSTAGYLSLDGQVHIKDWTLVGGGFDVNELDIDINDQVPFAGGCGFIHDEVEGDMSMANKAHLSFTGQITTNCGVLNVLQLEYVYSHRGVTQTFELDYSMTTGHITGGVSFAFNRSFSWKSATYRYHRHPKVYISLTFDMDVANPSKAAMASLVGRVSVSGGSGSLACSLSTSGDDSCHISVTIDSSIGGGYHFSDDW